MKYKIVRGNCSLKNKALRNCTITKRL